MSDGLLYFLLATAVALVVPAAEQRGWTPRRWIYGGVALVCLLAIPLWGPIGKYFPGAATFVEKISDSPSAWFTLVMVLFIVSLAPFRKPRGALEIVRSDAEDSNGIGDLRAYVESRFVGIAKGMEAIWEKINSIANGAPPEAVSNAYEGLKWMRADYAIKAFNPDLEETIKSVRLQCQEYDAEVVSLRKKNKELTALILGKMGQNADAEILEQNEITSLITKITKRSESGYRELRNLRSLEKERIIKLLEEGTLVAQGFFANRQAGSPPKNIPKEEWRLLKFDKEDIFLEHVTGPNIEYIGVRIAEAPKGSEVFQT